MAHGLDEDWEGGDRSPNVKQCEKKSKTPREGKGIGSRRIFTPQFKLQVLDSYRRDLDCRGNQRATARKYGIHRRQIQKWLQMESTLRSSAEASESGEVALNLAAGRQLDVGSASSDAGCLSVARQESPPSASPQPHSGLPTDEFVDVDKISDSEDDGGSSSSGASVYGGQERALDFTSAALSKRRFFSPDFKSEVVDAFYRDPAVRGNQRATARKFGIHRRQVQKWLNHEGSVTPTPRYESTECLLDLSQKRKLDAVEEEYLESTPLKRLSLDIEVIRQPVVTSVQETALCLVKTPPTQPEVTSSVDLFRPYSLCCAQVADYDPWTHYYPYYGVMDTSCVTKWLTRDAPYYRQTVNDVSRYTPMYS